MNEPTNDHKFEQEMNNNVVLSDSDIAKLKRAREVCVKLLLKQRRAMFKGGQGSRQSDFRCGGAGLGTLG